MEQEKNNMLRLEDLYGKVDDNFLNLKDKSYKGLLKLVPNFCRKQVYSVLGISYGENFNIGLVRPFTNTTLDRLRLAKKSRKNTELDNVLN